MKRELKKALRKAFGTGEIKYKKPDDFPSELHYNGCCWRRSRFQNMAFNIDMWNYLYVTNDRKLDYRLYVDAAGNIWDEAELGLL